jgi:hypothetical protein
MTNTLAYNESSLIRDMKSFITLSPGVVDHKKFVRTLVNNNPEALLTILHFVCNLRMGPIIKSACP